MVPIDLFIRPTTNYLHGYYIGTQPVILLLIFHWDRCLRYRTFPAIVGSQYVLSMYIPACTLELSHSNLTYRNPNDTVDISSMSSGYSGSLLNAPNVYR